MKMVSSGSINTVADKRRLSPYFGLYGYKLTASLPGIQYFRYTKTIRAFEERCENEVSLYSSTWNNFAHVNGNKWSKLGVYLDQSSPGARGAISDFISWKQKNKITEPKKFSLRVYRNSLDFYTNEYHLLADLYSLLSSHNLPLRVTHIDTTQIWDPGVVYHIKPKNKLRIFLNFYRFEDSQITEFNQFVTESGVRLCPSLKRSVTKILKKYSGGPFHGSPYERTVFVHSTQFFDIDEDHIITVAALKYPTLIRKVSKIEQR